MSRYLAPLYAVIAAFFLAGCMQSVFVGMPAPVPEQIILTPGDDAPTPPFGPSANLVLYEGPGETPPELADMPDVPAEPALPGERLRISWCWGRTVARMMQAGGLIPSSWSGWIESGSGQRC